MSDVILILFVKLVIRHPTERLAPKRNRFVYGQSQYLQSAFNPSGSVQPLDDDAPLGTIHIATFQSVSNAYPLSDSHASCAYILGNVS
jgi:hypothetical protein